METNRTPRGLTHDEQKAAEAAFGGRPFNPAWSDSARQVYEGLIQALPKVSEEAGLSALLEQHVDTPLGTESAEAVSPELAVKNDPQPQDASDTILAKREEAIRLGFLIDVTADAKKVGLAFPVTVTKPLWEVSIATSETLSDDARSARLRDILMAFRLRLANQATLSPLIDFPALLTLPPETVPQPIPLFALIQPDDQNRAMVTLLLPNEVSATIMPLN